MVNTHLVVHAIIICVMGLASFSAARPIAAGDLLYDMAVEPKVAEILRPVMTGDRAGCSAFKIDGFRFYRGTNLPGKSFFCAPLGPQTAFDIAEQCTHTPDCVSFNLYQPAGQPSKFCFNSARGPVKAAYNTVAKGQCLGVYVLQEHAASAAVTAAQPAGAPIERGRL